MAPDASSTRHVLVLRHASAGARLADRMLDEERPLDEDGLATADELARSLLEHSPTAILSSPAPRCEQTVAPLAAAVGLAVQRRTELAIGADPAATRALIASCADGTLVCTHGEVIAALLGEDLVPAKGDAQLVIGDGLDVQCEYVAAPAGPRALTPA